MPFRHIALDVRMSSFGLTQNQNHQLQLDRSRRPFGVRSSDWYQNDRTELYFQLVSLFSAPLKSCFLCFGKTTKLSDKN